MNNFYKKILDINPQNGLDLKIKKAINKSLVDCSFYTDGMCKVHSNNISANLSEYGIKSFIINTKDHEINYEHIFVIVLDVEDYYLIDITFNQFIEVDNCKLNNALDNYPALNLEEINESLYAKLINNRYVKTDLNGINDYLGSFKVDFKKDTTFENLIGLRK